MVRVHELEYDTQALQEDTGSSQSQRELECMRSPVLCLNPPNWPEISGQGWL